MAWIRNHEIEVLERLKLITREDLIKNGQRVVPAIFYVHTYHTKDKPVEEHRLQQGDIFYGKWDEWLDDKRIWVERDKRSYAI